MVRVSLVIRDASARCPRQEHLRGPRTEPPQTAESKPRYLRCNLLTTTRKEVSEKLAAEGVDAEDDAHVDDLLVTTAKVHGGHALVKAGEVILQDKSSCFPRTRC